ncbi:MAG TPA: hypothetical protein ENJ00_12290 [Phycisphaerales bacterium]|nr:hypothetical protein [Phycisphaerales bacterium]
MNDVRHIVGCMTGSSLDAIDVALVRVVGRGLAMQCDVETFGSFPLGHIRDDLRRLIAGKSVCMRTVVELGDALGHRHAEVIGMLVGNRTIDLVAAHGQTVVHEPPIGHQLLNPWPIAVRFGVPVVSSLRDADLASGGQGAPITPLADLALFRHPTQRRAVVNLGGFCNVTLLPACEDAQAGLDQVRGFDICPCNHWLDRAARALLGADFDIGGASAARGRVDPVYLAVLLDRLEHLAGESRSFGPADEELPTSESLSAPDALATIVRAIAERIAEATTGVDAVLLAGGSVANLTLVRAIGDACDVPVLDTSSAGMLPQAREAVAMAVLGALCQDGVAVCLPRVTGATKRVVAGSWVFPRGMKGVCDG